MFLSWSVLNGLDYILVFFVIDVLSMILFLFRYFLFHYVF